MEPEAANHSNEQLEADNAALKAKFTQAKKNHEAAQKLIRHLLRQLGNDLLSSTGGSSNTAANSSRTLRGNGKAASGSGSTISGTTKSRSRGP